MTDLQRLAVEILAATDVLFTPFRDWGQLSDGTPVATAIRERRRDYFASGLPLFSAGANAAERQAHGRNLDTLRRRGILEIRGRSRTRGLRLTTAGEARLRALVGTYSLQRPQPWLLLELIDTLGPSHVLEFDLVTIDRQHQCTLVELVLVELFAQPMLCRDWLRSHTDLRGRVGYLLTDQGRAALAAGPPDAPDDLPECDEAAVEVYDQHFRRMLAERSEWQPRAVHDLTIPLIDACNWARPQWTPRALELLAKLQAEAAAAKAKADV